jgi:hypothetical protein
VNKTIASESSLSMSDEDNFKTKDGLLKLYKRFKGSNLTKDSLTDRAIIMIYQDFTFKTEVKHDEVDSLIETTEAEVTKQLESLLKTNLRSKDLFTLVDLFDQGKALDNKCLALLNKEIKTNRPEISPLLDKEKLAIKNMLLTLKNLRAKDAKGPIVDTLITKIKKKLQNQLDSILIKKLSAKDLLTVIDLFDPAQAFDRTCLGKLSSKIEASKDTITSMADKDKVVIENMLTTLQNLRLKKTEPSEIVAGDKVIIKILHTVKLKKSKEQLKKEEKEKEKGDTVNQFECKWSETLIEIDTIELLCFYKKDKPIDLSLDYDELQSHFSKELKSLIKLIDLTYPPDGLEAARSSGIMPLQTKHVLINPDYIRPPFNLLLMYTNGDEKDTTTVFVDERYHFSLITGVSSSLLTRSQFSYDENDLTITLDSANKEEWKANLMVGLTFSLGGRTSKYAPKFRLSSYKEKENNFWKRTSLMAGCKLSIRPFDHLYLGMTHDFSKNITVMFGINQPQDLIDQTVEIGPDESVNKTLRNASRTTGDITFFWGIAFSPTEMLKMLHDE